MATIKIVSVCAAVAALLFAVATVSGQTCPTSCTKSMTVNGEVMPWISTDCRTPNSPCIAASCTANDITLAIVEVLTATSTTVVCTEGSLVLQSLKIKLTCGAQSRYDIGIFCKSRDCIVVAVPLCQRGARTGHYYTASRGRARTPFLDWI